LDEVVDEVEVIDPRHALFGRRFRVVSVTHPPQGAGLVFVVLRDGIHVRLPREATSLACSSLPSSTTITAAAVEQLLAFFQEVEESCRAARKRSGRGSRKASARPSSRNSR